MWAEKNHKLIWAPIFFTCKTGIINLTTVFIRINKIILNLRVISKYAIFINSNIFIHLKNSWEWGKMTDKFYYWQVKVRLSWKKNPIQSLKVMNVKMSDKTGGKGSIITTYFLKTIVQCAFANTKGQYSHGHHLKGYRKQIRKHDFLLVLHRYVRGWW